MNRKKFQGRKQSRELYLLCDIF